MNCTNFKNNCYGLSLTEKIFYWHVANSNPKSKNYLLSNMYNIYVKSREYTHCGMYVYISSLFKGDIFLPEHLYAGYINEENGSNVDFIIYTDKKNITTMELAMLECETEFDEMKIASLLLDNVLQIDKWRKI